MTRTATSKSPSMWIDNLLKIRNHLHELLLQLIYAPQEIHYESWKAQLEGEFKYIQGVEHMGQSNPEGKKIISNINMLAESLSLICVERISLKSRYASASSEDDQSSEYTDLSSQSENCVTPPATPKALQKYQCPDMDASEISKFTVSAHYISSPEIRPMDDDATKSVSTKDCEAKINKKGKGRRLSKQVVSILSHWYEENIDNPYLTNGDIVELRDQTGLKDNQIRNWVSNRRRKKSSAISDEVLKLLY